jgi:hypothetical protein
MSMSFRLRSMRQSYLVNMKKHFPLSVVFSVLILAGAQPVYAKRGDQVQVQVRMDMAAGQVKPLREIERRVVPQMRGMQYLGPEYDSIAQVYRLKFIDKDRVIFVDVDARSGQIIRQQ